MPVPTVHRLGPCAQTGRTGVDRNTLHGNRDNQEPTVLHALEQGCAAQAPMFLVGEGGRGAANSWTGPRLPTRVSCRGHRHRAPRSPVPAPFPPESLSLSHLSRRRVDGIAQPAAQDRPGEAARDPRVHQQPLIFLSIFTASSLLHVRVSEVCERKAGDVGRRDGEPGVGGRVGPALLCTPGRGRGRKVLRCLQGRLGTKKVTRCL